MATWPSTWPSVSPEACLKRHCRIAATVDPAAEAELVATAKRSHDLADTRDRAAKVRAAARNESPAARKRRLRAKRRWSEFTDDEMKAVAARWLPEEFALVAPVIDND